MPTSRLPMSARGIPLLVACGAVALAAIRYAPGPADEASPFVPAPTVPARPLGGDSVYVVDTDESRLPPQVQYDAVVTAASIPAVFRPHYQPGMRALVVSRHLLRRVRRDAPLHAALNAVLNGGHILFALDSDSADIVEALGSAESRLMPTVRVPAHAIPSHAGTGYFYNWALGAWSIFEVGSRQVAPIGEPRPPDVTADLGTVPYEEIHGTLLETLRGNKAPNWGILDGAAPDAYTGLYVVLDWNGVGPAMDREPGAAYRYRTRSTGLQCCPSGHMSRQLRVLAPIVQCAGQDWRPPCPPGRKCPAVERGAVRVAPERFALQYPLSPGRNFWIVTARIATYGTSSSLPEFWRGAGDVPSCYPGPRTSDEWRCRDHYPDDLFAWQHLYYALATKERDQADVALEDWQPQERYLGPGAGALRLGGVITEGGRAIFGYDWTFALAGEILEDPEPQPSDNRAAWSLDDLGLEAPASVNRRGRSPCGRPAGQGWGDLLFPFERHAPEPDGPGARTNTYRLGAMFTLRKPAVGPGAMSFVESIDYAAVVRARRGFLGHVVDLTTCSADARTITAYVPACRGE